jgi:uncharacterized membrane protein
MASSEQQYSLKRVEALSDGIFAIAMTILVLNITIPEQSLVHKIGLHQALWKNLNEFITYFMSFFLLGIFWMIQHKQLHALIKTNQTHIWMTLIMLMFVCLIPFSASLESDYSSDWIATFIFASNMLIVGILFLLMWHHATHKHRLVDGNMPRKEILSGRNNSLVFIAITLLVMVGSWIIPAYATILFFLVPFGKYVLAKIGKTNKNFSE